MSTCCRQVFRVVVPYVHEFTTFTKKRWIGRGILDVYKDEFSAHSAEYYEEAIRQGFINVNGKRCKEINQRLLNGDKIVHRSHRHEPPVLCGPLDICHSDDDVIIVQKPSTVPVHPCGAYYHNSLTHILRKEHPRTLHITCPCCPSNRSLDIGPSVTGAASNICQKNNR